MEGMGVTCEEGFFFKKKSAKGVKWKNKKSLIMKENKTIENHLDWGGCLQKQEETSHGREKPPSPEEGAVVSRQGTFFRKYKVHEEKMKEEILGI